MNQLQLICDHLDSIDHRLGDIGCRVARIEARLGDEHIGWNSDEQREMSREIHDIYVCLLMLSSDKKAGTVERISDHGSLTSQCR